MTVDTIGLIVAGLVGLSLVGGLGYLVGRRAERRLAEAAGMAAAQQADRIIESARREAETAKQTSVLEAKEEALRLRNEQEQEAKGSRQDMDDRERRLEKREATLEGKLSKLDERDRALGQREDQIDATEQNTRRHDEESQRLVLEQRQRLEQVAGLSSEQARQELLQRMEEEARADGAALVRDIKDQARREGDREAQKIIAQAVQRMAAEQTAESTVAAVALPNDEMKGRIIGREGRNIRAFETATGVDVIIDDTPDTVIVSCFDPVRREVARLALERLIGDGRIHPGRIEEVVTKALQEVERQMLEAAEQATYETKIHGLHPELLKLLGRMRFRTSYGQNLLEHTKEVVWIAGMLASELRLDATVAKRGAMLHDIGKVLTHDHEGTHVELGVEVARRYGESPIVINCIAAHHDDVPHESAISVIVQAADAISGARPGARRESFETYVKRLTRLEEIASSFPGVEKTFAIQAGREVRIVVTPDAVNDREASQLADEVARRIEGELQYPGQIKVTVIRETRAVDFAR